MQIYTNKNCQNPSDASTDSRSQPSTSTTNFRYLPGYPNTYNGENNQDANYYQGYHMAETYTNEKNLQQISYRMQEMNNVIVDLFGCCLFDSRSTTMLINKQLVPPLLVHVVGTTQAFTTK